MAITLKVISIETQAPPAPVKLKNLSIQSGPAPNTVKLRNLSIQSQKASPGGAPILKRITLEDRVPVPKGDNTFGDFTLLGPSATADDVVLDLEENALIKCCFTTPVLASAIDTDSFKNDFTSFLKRYDESITTVDMFLQKLENGAYVDKETLTDDSFGEFFALGFAVLEDENLVGYRIDWRDVLIAHGVGTYRLRFHLTDYLTDENDDVTDQYCLENYTTFAADKTTRITYTNNGLIGDINNDGRRISFVGLQWEDQVRLPESIITGITFDYEQTFTQYQNGRFTPVTSDKTPQYRYELRELPFSMHNFLSTNVFQSDKVVITDYNSSNPVGTIIDKEFKLASSYEPQYDGTAQFTTVELVLEQSFNNLDKRIC